MELAESTYHYQKNKIKNQNPNDEITELIKTIFSDSKGTHGYRRITLSLHNRGYQVNHKRVLRIMNDLNLKCLKFTRRTRKYSSYQGTVGTIAPNRINRKFNTPIPLQKIVTDVTEFKCLEGIKLYLSPMMDLHNSEILSYGLGKHPTLEHSLEPLKATIKIIKQRSKFRTTIHSDQGWQYQNKSWANLLKENGIYQSMSRKGNCLDNSPMENFFGLLKQEMYYGEKLLSYKELESKIIEYINYYNEIRIKEKLGGMSPVQYRIQSNQLFT